MMKILLYKLPFLQGNRLCSIKSQKGMSLLIAFFVVSVIFSIVLSLTSMLLNQLGDTRNAGNSVIAFFAAESGLEKTLYFDRKIIPLGGKRGICNICRECGFIDGVTGALGSCNNCQTTPLSANPQECDPLQCSNCQINYNTNFNGKSYAVTATITPDFSGARSFYTLIESEGSYQRVLRKSKFKEVFHESDIVTLPIIREASVIIGRTPTRVLVEISADILSPAGIRIVTAEILQVSDTGDSSVLDTVIMPLASQNRYYVLWSGFEGVYMVNIIACNNIGECNRINNVR